MRLAVSILALSVGMAARAQTPSPSGSPHATVPVPYSVQPVSDADQLASEIRLLAADPRNLQALVRAGELALKLDDDTAAAAFFARAERIDPRNARVKAGEGSLLVSAERPGEALRYFMEAESLGGDVRAFAADRGLAYDLIGEQDRAQRDYRLALRAGSNDEMQRRYALSLGISGRRDLALKQIEPLLRNSDRGAWRARAFILAMGGDRAGAEKIATSMMPAGMAQGLQPFFEILPGLRPADRAFAVHFGEVRATPGRMADARMAPVFAALPPDPTAPVEVVAVTQMVAAVDAREERRKARKARKDRREIASLTTPAAQPQPQPQPLPAPPVYAGQSQATRAATAPSAGATPATLAAPLAPATVPPARRDPHAAIATLPGHLPSSAGTAPPGIGIAAPKPVATQGGLPVAKPVAAAAPPVPQAQSAATPLPEAIASPAAPAGATPRVVVVASPIVSAPPPEANPVVASAVAKSVPTLPGGSASPVSSTPAPARGETSGLAAIVADIAIPGAELSGPPPVSTESKRLANDQAALERKADAMHALADAKAVADRKAADRKAFAEKKAAADRKIAEKKAAEEKRRNDPRILEPSRIWVQVAGGANQSTLPKEWGKLRVKSRAFGGKGGWTTPLRATNRILTGPFSSEDEAQDFVNTIRKDGLPGFVFVSEAGQKITRLAAK